MDETQYQAWWQLHRRVAVGETLSEQEQGAYQQGLAELEAAEWVALQPTADLLRPLQKQLQEISARNRQLAQEEAVLRARAADLEQNYLALTGEPLGLEI